MESINIGSSVFLDVFEAGTTARDVVESRLLVEEKVRLHFLLSTSALSRHFHSKHSRHFAFIRLESEHPRRTMTTLSPIVHERKMGVSL